MTLTDHTQLAHQSSVLKCCSNPMNLFSPTVSLVGNSPLGGYIRPGNSNGRKIYLFTRGPSRPTSPHVVAVNPGGFSSG